MCLPLVGTQREAQKLGDCAACLTDLVQTVEVTTVAANGDDPGLDTLRPKSRGCLIGKGRREDEVGFGGNEEHALRFDPPDLLSDVEELAGPRHVQKRVRVGDLR